MSPPERGGRPIRSSIALVAAALVAPWTAGRRARDVSAVWASAVAAVHIGVASALSAVLSSWTYLAGKGLILGPTEMDMGQDDLPPDTRGQVLAGLGASVVAWAALLLLILLTTLIVADLLYSSEKVRRGTAWRAACGATAWFVVWAAVVLAANGVRHHELRHPAAAVRAYAQLHQQGFTGSSALSPGPPEEEPLAGRGRLAPLAFLFPVLWAIGLPDRVGRRRWRLVVAAVVSWWALWIAVGRLLPWATIQAMLG